jgi:cellulose synthase/poly-beta-1,6-N-acetylglucosamine synthase-like glycosyltransferase
VLTNLLFFASVALLWLTVANFFTIRRPLPALQRSESVSILIPVRNEEANIADLVLSLQAQQFLVKPEILFINDSSTDKTAEKPLNYQMVG